MLYTKVNNILYINITTIYIYIYIYIYNDASSEATINPQMELFGNSGVDTQEYFHGLEDLWVTDLPKDFVQLHCWKFVRFKDFKIFLLKIFKISNYFKDFLVENSLQDFQDFKPLWRLDCWQFGLAEIQDFQISLFIVTIHCHCSSARMYFFILNVFWRASIKGAPPYQCRHEFSPGVFSNRSFHTLNLLANFLLSFPSDFVISYLVSNFSISFSSSTFVSMFLTLQ